MDMEIILIHSQKLLNQNLQIAYNYLAIIKNNSLCFHNLLLQIIYIIIKMKLIFANFVIIIKINIHTHQQTSPATIVTREKTIQIPGKKASFNRLKKSNLLNSLLLCIGI
jgi:hypothetical protein